MDTVVAVRAMFNYLAVIESSCFMIFWNFPTTRRLCLYTVLCFIFVVRGSTIPYISDEAIFAAHPTASQSLVSTQKKKTQPTPQEHLLHHSQIGQMVTE